MSEAAFAFRLSPRPRGGWYIFAEDVGLLAQHDFSCRLRNLLAARGVNAWMALVSRGQGAGYTEGLAVVAPDATEADLPAIADAAAAVIRAEAAAA